MKLNEWLDAVEGRTNAVAAHFGVSKSAVSQWRGRGVPVDNMKALRERTQGRTRLHGSCSRIQACRMISTAISQPNAARARAVLPGAVYASVNVGSDLPRCEAGGAFFTE